MTHYEDNQALSPFLKDGTYSVKSGYGVIFNSFYERKGSRRDKSRLCKERENFCKRRLWNLPGPRSWKILVWKIITDSLPVGYEFERRKLDWDSSCQLCKGMQPCIEILEHLFRDCEVSSRIWAGSPLGINSAQGANIKIEVWIINWIHYLITIEDSNNRIIQFLVTIVGIWNMRNSRIFRKEVFNPVVFFKKYSQGGYAPSNKDKLSNEIHHEDNELDRMKEGKPFFIIGTLCTCQVTCICVDASWEKSFAAAFGWVAYNSLGVICFEGAIKGMAESPLQAEAMGIKVALEWANRRGILHLEISSDCFQLLIQWTGQENKHHQVRGILEDISTLASSFHCLCFSYVRRNLNGGAHGLAKRALRSH
ncbi:uncharacterized protein LOC141632633 [Silene latifolia]|uniref:uncharacterized protein LOC141632633 n=1 Tax=Silene latifolia TaxID=37657 RepID=UPI003D77A76F